MKTTKIVIRYELRCTHTQTIQVTNTEFINGVTTLTQRCIANKGHSGDCVYNPIPHTYLKVGES